MDTTKVEEICGICGDDYSDVNIKYDLKCNHSFHYDCLVHSFKSCNKRSNSCPYCRHKEGLLDLPEGRTPIKFINKMPSTLTNVFKCKAILKSGPRKNNECGCSVVLSYTFCKRHLKPK